MQDSFIFRIISFSTRNSWLIIILAILITIFFGYFALKIEINPDIYSLIPKDEENTQRMAKYGGTVVSEDYIIVAVESADLFTIEKLQIFYNGINKIENIPEVSTSINPFNLVTFQKDGARIEVRPLAMGAKAPDSEETIEDFKRTIMNDPFARNSVISNDKTVLAAFFPAKGLEDFDIFMAEIHSVVDELENHFKTYVAGTIPTEYTARQYLSRDFQRLIILASLCVLIIYYFGFKAKRSVLLPMIVISMGTIWTLGFMRLFGFDLSVISIVTPPLVLTLGSSYSIHILNQYYREATSNNVNSDWIARAVTGIDKTILMAALTTIVGFCSLLSTQMQQAREFGISTSFGIFSCALLSLLFFPAVLSLLDRPSDAQRRIVVRGILVKAMRKLSVIVMRRKRIIISIVIILIVLFAISLNYISHQVDYTAYYPEKERVVRDTAFITEKIGGFQQINITLTAPEGEKNYFLNQEVLKKIAGFEHQLKEDEDVSYITSFVAYLRFLNSIMFGKDAIPEKNGLILLLSRYFGLLTKVNEEGSIVSTLVNEDFSQMTIAFRVFNSETGGLLHEDPLREFMRRLESYADANLDPATTPEIWGNPLRFLTLSRILTQDLRMSTLIAICLIFLITSTSFKSVRYGIFSLIPLATGIMLNFSFMALSRIPLDMTTVMVSSIAIGVGVDYSIHFILRYRKELEKNPTNFAIVISETLSIAGRPIILTTVSIIAGLLVLTFASFRPVAYFGLLVAFALLTTGIGTLLVLPVVMSVSWKARRKKELRYRKIGIGTSAEN